MKQPYLFCLALASAACSPLSVINGLTPEDTYVRQSGIDYGVHDAHKLDIYRPLGQNAQLPVVVFFYGGSWREGSREDYRFVGEALAARGIVAVIPDYRKYPEITYPAFIEDSAQAVAWVMREAARHGGDPRQVYVMGHSAGAYNAAMLAYDARWLAAQGVSNQRLAGFVGLAGPYNFLPIVVEEVKPVFHWPDTGADTQPITHIGRDAPPAVLLLANADSAVHPEVNSERFAAALRAKGNQANVVRYDGLNHVTLIGAMARPLRWLAPVLDDATEGILSRRGLPQRVGYPYNGGHSLLTCIDSHDQHQHLCRSAH